MTWSTTAAMRPLADERLADAARRATCSETHWGSARTGRRGPMTWPKSLRGPLRSWRPLRGTKVLDTSQNQRRTSRVLWTLLLYATLVLATGPGNVRASIRQTTAEHLGANGAAASVAPLFRTVRLDGGKLHGLTKSDEAGSGQGPVDVNVRVKKGQFRWYDRLTTADQMYASGEYARAFHVYDDVIAMPGFPVKHRPAVLLSAARTLAAQHRDLEAGRLLEAAFEDKPSLATTEALRFTAGLLAARAADWSNARHLYLQVIAQNPHHMDALNHLAMLELIVGNLDAFQTRFLHFIRIQSAVAENRQHRLFQSVNHSYKSSFRKDRLGQEMTAWLTDHVMLSFSLDGAPSRLAAAALAGNADLEGYLPGSIEANCVLVYTAYTRTLISGTRFDAQGADLNRGLLHFNLAQRLRRVGALDEAAWHLQFAADLDARQRRGILLFQAALLQSRASSVFAARNERLAHFSTRLSALEELLQAPENGSSFHCMALSASLDLPAERALTEALKRAASAACDIDLAEGDEQLARVPTKDADRVRRIGVFSAEFCNSTSGRMLVPLLRAIGLQKARFNADLVLFTWPLLPSRRYLVYPEMLNNIDPFNAGLAAETIRSQRLDELIVVDAHRDLRVWLLANTRGLAPRVSHWNLASPRGALARMTPKVQTSFLFALFDDLWNWSSPPRPRHQSRISASIQGQYFFAEELYFLIAGRALDVDPDPGLEDFIETLHALHSSTVVIFIGGEADESVARTALWKRLAARKIDLSRVRVLRRLPRDVFLTFVEQNVDVVVESPRPRDGALFVVLEALRLNVPVVACECECEGHGEGESESTSLKHDDTDYERCSSWAAPLLRGFGVDALSLAKNPKDLARLAFRLTGSISAERNAFVQSLQARPQTDDTGTTCILNGYESTVSALL